VKNKLQVLLNAHDSSAEILLYAPIGSFFEEDISARDVAETLNLLKNISNIIVRINSPGGEVFEGLAIYNSLVKHPAKIHVEIEGMALSIASVITMAGDSIIMSESSLFMIHNPLGFAIGDAEEMRKTAEMMDKAKATLIKAYRRQTNLSENTISTAMDAETWYTASEAKEAGFVTGIFEAQRVSAKFDLDKYKFKNVPSNQKLAPKNKITEKKNAHLKEALKDVALPDDTSEAKDDFDLNEILLKKIELAEMAV